MGKTSVREVYEIIRKKILFCEFKPGELISEKQIVEDLGTSRTPVREAVNILNGEGLLDVLPKKGIQISDLSTRKLVEVYQIRSMLEPLSIKEAIKFIHPEDIEHLNRLNDETGKMFKRQQIYEAFNLGMDFHLYLTRVAKNETLFNILKGLRDESYRGLVFYLIRYLEAYPDKRERVLGIFSNGHKLILDAIKEKNEEQAVHLTLEDMKKMSELLKEVY